MAETEKAFQRAVELPKCPQENFMELGRCLARLKEEPEEFRRFLKMSGMGSRKAYYLISISQVFGPLRLPKARLKKIGWTKLQVPGDEISGSTRRESPSVPPRHGDYWNWRKRERRSSSRRG